jgi:drug/metabolite transporter (DMT)-like permease
MKISPGIRYMLLSTLFLAFMNLCVKQLSHIPPYEILFFRALISGVICLGMLWRLKVNPLGNNKKLLVMRGFAGIGSLLLYFTTLQHIPLASAVTIQYLAPIFTAMMAVFVLNEKMHWKQWAYFLVSFAGVVFMKGTDARVPMLYLLIGIGSALFTSAAFNVVRKLNQTEHPLVIILYFPLIAMPLMLPFTIYYWVQPQNWDWLVILLMGLFTQAGQVYLTKAIQAEELSKITYLNYLGIIYALGLGFIFFGEVFHLGSLFGMALVLCGVLLNLNYKRNLDRKKLFAARNPKL